LLPLDRSDDAEKAARIGAELEPILRELHRQQPIQAGMLSVIFRKVLEVVRLNTLKLAKKDFQARATPLLAGAHELSEWLCDPKNTSSISEINTEIESWLSWYIGAGLKGVADYTDQLRKAWLTQPRGRPATRRRAAIEALEAKLADPKLSWEELADTYYPPARDENLDCPAQALRQEVIALRHVLKKYEIPGWEPFKRHPAVRKLRNTAPK
jgi:hypothetical protein